LVEILACLDRIEDLGRQTREGEEAAPVAEAAAGSPAPKERTGGKLVFLCDDEALQAEQLGAQLSCFGYAVRIFTDTASLRAALQTTRPDAVVMDIIFPEGNNAGTEHVAAFRNEMADPPPVVFVSSRPDFAARLQAVQAGGEAYFVKPVKALDLVDSLDGLIRGEEIEPLRVLIVDDEPEVAAYHGIILEQAGMTIQMLQEPARILDVLGEFAPDLVLMDMYMPACSGRDLSRLIRQVPEFLSLPILFLSVETNKVKQVSALRVGAEGFLTKPIQPEDLVSAVAIRAERMRTLRMLMVRDSLTGLFNHSFVLQFFEKTLAATRRAAGRMCFVMIDVDHFKRVNDGHGHAAGDRVLLGLARLLQQRLRHSDMVGRYGGEEFAVILGDVGTEEALRVIDDLRQDFAKISFPSDRGDFCCTFSAGIAGYPDRPSSEELLECADQALYRAKQAGRNRVLLTDR
jgi:diguanylate cyclase (GGDEF)-like protein